MNLTHTFSADGVNGLGSGLVVKCMDCSFRGSKFNSHDPPVNFSATGSNATVWIIRVLSFMCKYFYTNTHTHN